MALISKPINLSTEANLLYEIYKTLKKINIASGSSGSQNLAQTLLIDNKTNDIPIVSNNGLAVVYFNDVYLTLSYDTQSFTISNASVQLYSEVPVAFDSTVSTDFNTPVLNYNGEEVATQDWVTSQGYDMITGLTFSGVFSLDKKGGRSYLPYTQTGSLTLSIGGSPIVGGFAVLRFTANGSAISGYSGWKLLSSDGITATNGVVHRVIVYQYEDEIWYSVKLN